MRKMSSFRKTVRILLAGMLLLTISGMASAAGGADWTVRNGNVKGESLPIQVEEDEAGVMLTGTGAYTFDSAAGANAQSVTYNQQVDVTDFSMEFQIEQIASDQSQGGDSWISLSLLNSDKFFNVANPNDASGLVILMRANEGRLDFQSFILDDLGFTPAKILWTEHNAKGKFKVEFKRDEQAETWHLYLNGQQLDDENQYEPLMASLFEEGKAYLTVGAADKDFGTNQIKLLSLNGQSLSASATEATPAEATTTEATPTEATPAEATTTEATPTETTPTEAASTEPAASAEADGNGLITYGWIAAAAVAAGAALVMLSLKKRKTRQNES